MMRDKIKEQLIRIFEKPDWKDGIQNSYLTMREDIIWIMSDFVKEKKYISQAMDLAEMFVTDPNPTVEDRTNQELLKGEDVRYIATVRGSLCWLLSSIVGTLDVLYYPRIINLLEVLTNDPVIYVRLQSTYPLTGLMQNVQARRNQDGSEFKFLDPDRDRVIRLAFEMVKNNEQYPAVLEGLQSVFDKMRFIKESEALFVLKTFLYRNESKSEFHSTEYMENVPPLLLFFAEFAKDHNPNFQNVEFQNLLKQVIKTGPSRLKSNIVWHIWKTIETSPETYPKFKEYIPLFFEGQFQEEPLGQYEFLIKKIMLQSPQDAIEIFRKEIGYLKKYLPEIIYEPGGRIWFFDIEDIIEEIAKITPHILPEVLYVLTQLYLKRGYIGKVDRIFKSYELAPQNLKEDLKKQIDPLYQELQSNFSQLPPL